MSCGGEPPGLRDGSDVLSSADLVDLEPLRRRGCLAFQYRRQPLALAARAARAAERRLRPGRTPRTAGLRFARARPEAVAALLNQLSSATSPRPAPPGTPPLWVTSLARSIEHQHRCARPGLHGDAAQRALRRLRRRHRDVLVPPVRRAPALRGLLLERQAAGEVNVIDEGQAWHVCLSPAGRRPRSVRDLTWTAAEPRVRHRPHPRSGPGPSDLPPDDRHPCAPRGEVEEVRVTDGLLAGTQRLRIVDRRPGRAALDLRGRPVGALLQRRDLQPPGAARRASRPRPPVPHRQRHRGRAGGLPRVGRGRGQPAARRVRVRDRRAGRRGVSTWPATRSA